MTLPTGLVSQYKRDVASFSKGGVHLLPPVSCEMDEGCPCDPCGYMRNAVGYKTRRESYLPFQYRNGNVHGRKDIQSPADWERHVFSPSSSLAERKMYSVLLHLLPVDEKKPVRLSLNADRHRVLKEASQDPSCCIFSGGTDPLRGSSFSGLHVYIGSYAAQLLIMVGAPACPSSFVFPPRCLFDEFMDVEGLCFSIIHARYDHIDPELIGVLADHPILRQIGMSMEACGGKLIGYNVGHLVCDIINSGDGKPLSSKTVGCYSSKGQRIRMNAMGLLQKVYVRDESIRHALHLCVDGIEKGNYRGLSTYIFAAHGSQKRYATKARRGIVPTEEEGGAKMLYQMGKKVRESLIESALLPVLSRCESMLEDMSVVQAMVERREYFQRWIDGGCSTMEKPWRRCRVSFDGILVQSGAWSLFETALAYCLSIHPSPALRPQDIFSVHRCDIIMVGQEVRMILPTQWKTDRIGMELSERTMTIPSELGVYFILLSYIRSDPGELLFCTPYRTIKNRFTTLGKYFLGYHTTPNSFRTIFLTTTMEAHERGDGKLREMFPDREDLSHHLARVMFTSKTMIERAYDQNVDHSISVDSWPDIIDC